MSHSERTLTPPTEDRGHNSKGGDWKWLLSVHCLFKEHPMRRKKRGQKKMYIGRNLRPQAQNESMERHCFVCTTEILWKTNLLSAPLPMLAQNRYSVGPEPDQPAPPLQQSCRSQTPNCDAQWIKQKVWRHLISLTESLIQCHNWRKKTTRPEKLWPESRVLSRFILKCKSTLKNTPKFVKVHYLRLHLSRITHIASSKQQNLAPSQLYKKTALKTAVLIIAGVKS